jgi:DNA-binding transcriptional MerR regulator
MIPNKSNFKFQELTPITGVKPYVIRYWETEFEEIAPLNSDSGQKLYARRDVEAILRIKKLLFDDKLSIPEAKAQMKNFEAGIEDAPVEGSKTDHGSQFATEKILEGLHLIRDLKLRRNW